PDPHPAAVEGCIAPAADDAGASIGDRQPVAMPPYAGVRREVRGPHPGAVRVAPQGDRHRRHRRRDDELALPPDDRATTLVERLDARAEHAAADLALPDRHERARAEEP